ncbi:MAG: hypothetical protein QOH10_1394 [Actinomycetota bacterium]|nr:hypothetical protein [Actinomycetota bacterium]
MEGFDVEAFAEVQRALAPMWPELTMRRRSGERTLLVLSSVSFAVPDHLHVLLPAYEERYLSYVLTLVQAPATRVIYVTSQPMLARMLDYYLDLIPNVDREDLRRRLIPISVGDWSPRPLTEKILERPRLIARLRSLIPDPARAVIIPFASTALEARLSVELGVAIYGSHPRLEYLGTKSGSREAFRASGVPCPSGAEGIRSVDEIVDVLVELVDARGPEAAIVKLDGGVSGLGNAVVDLRDARDRREIENRVRRLSPEDDAFDAESFLAELEAQGGIVEERITGDDFRSPSVQLRASPEGVIEVLTTHDQMLGGPSAQTYFGCTFPADPAYAGMITQHARAVGLELAARGVIGRFAIDFVATRAGEDWSAYAVEINLRSGGTTHPYLALFALTEGVYDADSSQFLVDGVAKHYVATDHLETPNLRTLTPDDVLDVIGEAGLGWDHARLRGLVFHMLSGVGVAGRLGVTAIADSAMEAKRLYGLAEDALTAAAAPLPRR